MKRYYWLKFPADFFTSMRVRALEKANKAYLLIYLKMMVKAVTTEGKIEFKGVFESLDEEIALDIGADMEDVQATTALLKKYGLLKEEEGSYFLPWVAGSIGSETASAERMRRARASQSDKESAQSDKEVAQSDTDIDIEKDIEKEEKRNKKKDELPTYDASNNPDVDLSRIDEIRGRLS